MRIVFLNKRYYMNHDVIQDRYARLYEQPFNLANLGHDVLGVCSSYYPTIAVREEHQTSHGSLHWIGLSPGRFRFNFFSQMNELANAVKEFNPDIIVGASDAIHVILAHWLSVKLNRPFAIDLYDDFESFGLSKLPLVKYFYRRALRKASVISCVSNTLTKHVEEFASSTASVICLPSTIDKNIFKPHNKSESRNFFGLPENATLLGTAGGLTKEKGISTVYEGFIKLTERHSNIYLVLAGSIDPKCPPPLHPNVHYLGRLAHSNIPKLFSAIDIGVIYINNNTYGKFSFPQKAYEFDACNTPLVASKVGDTAGLYASSPEILYAPNDSDDFARAVEHQLKNKVVYNREIEDWADQAKKLEAHYQKTIQNGTH